MRKAVPLALLMVVAGLSLSPSVAAACLASPSACGYPDATNTGVPAGTALTPSGSRTVSSDGAVLSGLDLIGTVTVAADNVKIEDSRITRTSGDSGSYAVILDDGADNFTIEDSEISGPASDVSGLQSAVWNHNNNPGATATRVYFHRCADCWEGAGTFRDAYMVVDAAYTGSHDEDIYVCGASVNVDHSTLINTHQQTATVFGDTICGGNDFTVTDSLLAGGGYILYPQANSSSAVGSTNVSGNRFARCATSPVYDPGSGGTACGNGADAFGYFPLGGYYGVAAYTYSGPHHIWEGNVWDDSSQPVCDDGQPGCDTALPTPDGPGQPGGGSSSPEGPTGPARTAALGSPAGARSPHRAVRAIWHLPTGVRPGEVVELDGSASKGTQPLTCIWTVKGGPAVGVYRRRRGCAVRYRAPRTGTRYVTLTVRDRYGHHDSLQRAISGRMPRRQRRSGKAGFRRTAGGGSSATSLVTCPPSSAACPRASAASICRQLRANHEPPTIAPQPSRANMIVAINANRRGRPRVAVWATGAPNFLTTSWLAAGMFCDAATEPR